MERSRGFSVVEVLVGTVIIMGAIGGVVSLVQMFNKNQLTASKTTTMESIATAILSSLGREAAFEDPDSELRNYDESTLQNFKLNYFGMALAEKRAGVWIPQYFDSNGDSCEPGLVDPDCNVRVDFDMQVSTTATLPRWRASFNVSIVSNAGKPIPVRIASNPSEVSVSRKFTSYSPDKTKCAAGEIAVRGYDASGSAECWRESPIKCATNELVVGHKFTAGGTVEPICQAARGVRCADDNFVLDRIKPHYLDRRVAYNGADSGRCVYITQEEVEQGHPLAPPDHPQRCPSPGYREMGATKCELEPTLKQVKPPVERL